MRNRGQLSACFGISENHETCSDAAVIISDIAKYCLDWCRYMPTFRNSETLASTLPALGARVRSRRKTSGLRIDDAAALCGVSVDLLSRLENGKSGVSTQRLLKVLEGLGLTLLVVEKERLADLLPPEPSPR